MTDIRRLLPLLLLTLIPILSAYGLEITSTGTAADGVNGFTELTTPNGVAVFDSGANTYAIVAGYDDDGVQIIDITDPGNPTASGAAADGANGFTKLDGPRGVAVFDSGANTYAIVTSYVDDGVQIIDITDPGNPTASGAAADGANGFTHLNGARGVAVFDSGANTYAIVAGYHDDGVQIIDITDPANPTASGAATDGANGFTELDGPRGVAVFDSGASTYAIVAGYIDNGVQIIDITDPANPTASSAAADRTNGFMKLGGPRDVAVFDSGANTYAIVTGYHDDGVMIIDITDPANPTASGAATDGANDFTELDGPSDVAVFDSGANTYAIVTGYNDDGVQIIDITDPANPTADDAAADGVNSFTELHGPRGVAVFDSGASTYAIVAGYRDNGVQIIRLGLKVLDTTPPVVTAPADITAEATGPLTPLDVGAAAATDNLDRNPIITHDAPESFPPGETTVTWTATDAAGNTATATQIVTVQYPYSEELWYNHTREAGNQTDTVKLQAHRGGDSFSLRCLFFGQNASVWHNQSTTYYEAEHSTAGTVHARCYEKSNAVPAFQVTSYAPYTPGSGFDTINEVFGSDGLFGVPLPFLFILLVASMWTGRSAQVGIIVTAATIGIMTALGLFELQPEAWALIVLLTAAGVFLGKKLF